MTVKTEDAKRMEPLVSRECESCGRSMIRVVDDNKFWWECYTRDCVAIRQAHNP